MFSVCYASCAERSNKVKTNIVTEDIQRSFGTCGSKLDQVQKKSNVLFATCGDKLVEAQTHIVKVDI